MNRFLIVLTLLLSFGLSNYAQTTQSGISYSGPKEYEIGGITITGAEYFDHTAIRALTGLRVGQKIQIPGEEITKAVKNLWDQKLFADIKVTLTKIESGKAFINFAITGRPRLSKFKFTGIRKGEADDLREEIRLIRGKVVTENLVVETANKVENFFIEKGYLDVDVEMEQQVDSSLSNNVIIIIKVEKNNRIKIKNINFKGNESIRSARLRRAMKETKRRRPYNIFTVSKFQKKNYEQDKVAIINLYNSYGFRDARIVKDTVYRVNKKLVNIDIEIEEGKKYYFRNITWLGNTIYPTSLLKKILGIKKGDVYNQELLISRLQQDKNGRDISSLYLDDGYLFFNVTPVEVLVDGDSIDYEIRIFEGKQARINRVTITGKHKN